LATGLASSLLRFRSPSAPLAIPGDLPPGPQGTLDGRFQPPAAPFLPRPPFARNGVFGYRNVHRFSIAIAFRLRLRSRLTLSGRALLRNPWAFGGSDSHGPFRYSYRHSHSPALQPGLLPTFAAAGDAPLPFLAEAAASVARLSPVTFSAPAHSTSELLRTLQMVAASKPTSWLSVRTDYLSHLARPWGP
jgi:hypothetical protein